ncbi:MAG: orotate phosphoribosyltransferase [Bacteroidales bacterium]|nr:orotate phosphoribosyltransferase [Bacteroidales bacterium]MCF8390246.1 orotate phosphoribosyltransferase [Bacteroidales bacterium]
MILQNQIAEYLLQSKAIKLDAANPFTWASGWRSPIYCDNRITLSYPEIRSFIRDQFIGIIRNKYPQCNLIAGVATGAIAQAALVADKMELPFVYVRPEPKKHGRENLIEGEITKGQKVVVIEDLISTGGSSLKAVEALRSSGVEVLGMAAIFSYGFEVAEKSFLESECALDTLGNYNDMLEIAVKMNYIEEKYLNILKIWRESPSTWGK